MNFPKIGALGRNIYAYITQKLPYAGFDEIAFEEQINPKYKYFNTGTDRNTALANQSVVIDTSTHGTGDISTNNYFNEVMYAQLQQDKYARLRDYRAMASFSEVADALDEICDEAINVDYNGECVKLVIQNANLDSEIQEELKESFQRIATYFDFQNYGWQYFRDWLVEGELFFEHILHEDHPDKGILGIMRIPTELVDPVFGNLQNYNVQGYLYKKPIVNPQNPQQVERFDYVPLAKNQVTYINSGSWNESKNVIIPYLENGRRAYRQLSLIEDAIIIYRLIRAPERLVFNVDVGNMSPPMAESYLRKLKTQYWSTKTFDINQNDIAQKYAPQSMLDAFWFAKRSGSEGTNVSTLPQSTANLGEIADLTYFIKKLYRSLKVPSTRLAEDSSVQTDGTILREELKFAKFVVRLQQRFAAALKDTFITHLKLTEQWDEYDMDELDFTVSFNTPTNYFELREIQKLQGKSDLYSNLTSSEKVSHIYMQKRILGWSDKDILANIALLKKDKALQWELTQIETNGPNWKEMYLAQLQQGGEQGGDLMGSMDGGMGGQGGMGGAPAGTPPPFGGAPPAEEGPATDDGTEEAVPAPAQPQPPAK